MIVKEFEAVKTTDKRLAAGQAAEKQMAFYLKREFKKDENIFVFNDLRLIHEDEVAQIDHLVLHPYGFALIESKSVTGTIEINKFDEWARVYGRKKEGMRSPIIQLEMQKKILISLIDNNAEKVLGKVLGIQKCVGGRKYDCIAAISNQTVIKRDIDTTDVLKADMVSKEVRNRIKAYKRGLITGDTVWFNKSDMESICRFLRNSHTPKQKNKLVTKKPYPSPSIKVESAPTEPVISEPSSSYGKSINRDREINTEDYWACACGSRFEIRHKHSFYRYCPDCRKILKLSPKCPECGHNATLSQPENTRIITYTCQESTDHHGVFHANSGRYKKDESTLRGNKCP